MRILLAEDDRMIGAALSQSLKQASYAVDWVYDGRSAMEAFDMEEYTVILLDLGLPGLDGLDVLRKIRAARNYPGGLRNSTPVLIITARDAVEARIQGLDLGADDYIVKPFEARELMARMRAVIRRRDGQADSVLTNGSMHLDLSAHSLTANGLTSILSGREFSLMQALLARPGAVYSREQLENKIYGWGEEIESNAVEVLIHSIRKKFGTDTIKNIRGVGWVIPRSDK